MAISGHQWPSVALSGTHWQSVTISGNPWQSVAISDTHWQSVAIRGNPWPSVASHHRGLGALPIEPVVQRVHLRLCRLYICRRELGVAPVASLLRMQSATPLGLARHLIGLQSLKPQRGSNAL